MKLIIKSRLEELSRSIKFKFEELGLMEIAERNDSKKKKIGEL